MSAAPLPQLLTRWQRLVLAMFVFDIMIVYPTYNRINESSVGNRLVLALLICLVFAAFARRWVRTVLGVWDMPTTLLAGYLLWITLSLMGSVIFGVQSPDAMLTYGLNSIAPLVLYACFIDFPERRFVVMMILFFTVMNIFTGLATLGILGLTIPRLTPILQELVFDPDKSRLGALIGKSTVIGYLSVFAFARTLFFAVSRWRYLLLCLFAVATLLSFQRSMWAGLLLALGLYMFFARRSVERRLADATVAAVTLPVIAIVLFANFDFSVVTRLITSRLAEFNLSDAIQERSDQQLVLNTENSLQILIGEGYGKYSPLNKEENLLNLPDAPLFLIYNETGLIGLGLFVGAIVAFMCRAVARRNLMLVWLAFHLAIVLLGSRILWYFPLNFLILILLAMYKDDSDEQRAVPRAREA
jgi:hypothetical protein